MKKTLFIFAAVIFIFTALTFATACDKNAAQDGSGNALYGSDGEAVNGVEISEINFPDAVFREWLKDPANINGAGSDGYLSADELQNIKSINIRGTSDSQIADLKGIEYFTELTSLSVTYNSLTSLDLSKNTKITYLNCSYNRLENIFISNLSELYNLNCEFNYLKELDLSGNGELTVLYCRHNVLESLDLSNNTKLVFIETFDNKLTEIDVSMLSQLEFLHIDHNRLTVLDMSHNLNLKGGGFVVRNNDVRKIILPAIEGFTVYYDDFAEQDPIKGYETSLWYADEDFTIPVTSDVEAKGQTLYAKRIANSYTVNFSADGATGVPSSIKTYYDTAFSIPDSEPYKKGYKFLYWSDDKYSAGNNYQKGQEVSNLAGERYDGEKITLYAKWQGVNYTISFDKNADDATGSMTSADAVYGSHFLLPSNTFERLGYDFAGWSLIKDGEVAFSDGESVLDLTSVEGADITLYAVWSENEYSLQQPYIDSLRAKLEALSLQSYYEEDLYNLNSIYNTALDEINAAAKDSQLMKSITDAAISDMNTVCTKEQRAEQIAEKWKSDNSDSIDLAEIYPIPKGSASSFLQEVSPALNTADTDTFSSYSSLVNQTDREDAAANALDKVQAYISSLSELSVAAQWITETEVITETPLSSILPKNAETCRILTDRYYSFSPAEKKYVDADYADGLNKAYETAVSKTAGIEALNRIYESIDLSQCSQENTELINSILQNSRSLILSAESVSSITTVIEDTTRQINEVLNENEGSGDNDAPETPDDPDSEKPDTDAPDEETPSPEVPPTDVPDNGKKDEDKTVTTAVALTLSVIAAASVIATIAYYFVKRKKSK